MGFGLVIWNLVLAYGFSNSLTGNLEDFRCGVSKVPHLQVSLAQR